MDIRSVQVTQEEADELYRTNFLLNSQELVLKIISSNEDFNLEVYKKEKEELELRRLQFDLVYNSIIDKYFSEEKKQYSRFGFSLDMDNHILTFTR